jgi:hypothetical protein
MVISNETLVDQKKGFFLFLINQNFLIFLSFLGFKFYMQSTPSWFGRKYFTEEEGDVTLTVLNEGSWPPKYHVCKTCKGSGVRMKEGWGRFLAVGGISSFHLLKDDKVVFQISISRPDKKETIRSFAS